MSLYALYERIPPDWIGLFLGSALAWVVFRLLDKNDLGNQVREMIFNGLLIYIILSRFVAGFVLHFNFNVKNDLLSALNGSDSYGWLFGLLGIVVYVLATVNRHRELQTDALYFRVTSAVLLSSSGFFIYIAFVSLHPYRLEASLRAAGMMLLLMLTVASRKRLVPQQLKHKVRWPVNSVIWVFMGVCLLATSVLVPPPIIWTWFSPAQWWFICIIIVAWMYSKRSAR
jgi:hypothetical protein